MDTNPLAQAILPMNSILSDQSKDTAAMEIDPKIK
jgi:hypothetical protein